jgi:Nif-specific regulatory protein
VRELENCVRRTATLAEGPSIIADDFACSHNECMSSMLWKSHADVTLRPRPELPLPIMPTIPANDVGRAHSQPKPAFPPPDFPDTLEPDESGMSERDRLVNAMERAGWVQAKAARLLGLTPRQIGYALKKHDVEVKRF